MPDDFDAPVEQATAAPGEKRDIPETICCPNCGTKIRLDWKAAR